MLDADPGALDLDLDLDLEMIALIRGYSCCCRSGACMTSSTVVMVMVMVMALSGLLHSAAALRPVQVMSISVLPPLAIRAALVVVMIRSFAAVWLV